MDLAGISHHSDKSERRRLLAKARRLRTRADGFAGNGRFREAIACLEEVVLICPADETSYLKMGSLYQETRKYERSLDAMLHAIAINPGQRIAHEAVIQNLVDLGRLTEAIAGCAKLLSIHPSNLMAREVLCMAYMQQGDLERSLRISAELIRIDPYNPNHHFKSGMLLQQKGRLGPAIRAFEIVLAMVPNSSELFHDAEEALEEIDEQQMSAIMTLLGDDRMFEIKFLRSPMAVLERGFVLSRTGMNRLRNVIRSASQERHTPQASFLQESTTRYYN
jgi:tetratricopeptide (TPR) repeat protein